MRHLLASVSEGFAGRVGGETVEDEMAIGGSGRQQAVVGVEGHACDLVAVILGARRREDHKDRDEDGGGGGGGVSP